MSNKCAKCNDYSWIKIITKCDTKVKRNVPEVLKRIVGYEQDYKCPMKLIILYICIKAV